MIPQHRTSLHGTLLKIFGHGILLTGPSGCGKSQLALSLLERGHALISDDLVMIERQKEKLVCAADSLGAGLLHVRDLGVINVVTLLGSQYYCPKSHLSLIIQLEDQMQHPHEIHPQYGSTDILSIHIPTLKLTLSPLRPLSLLVEIAVKQWDRMEYHSQHLQRASA